MALKSTKVGDPNHLSLAFFGEGDPFYFYWSVNEEIEPFKSQNVHPQGPLTSLRPIHSFGSSIQLFGPTCVDL